MIEERRITVGGIGTRYWEAPGADDAHPVVFVHGNPTSADDWLPFLSRLKDKRRCLAPDLVGWGKSERPPDLRYTMDTLAWFVERFIDALALERFDMVVHDWGSIGLVPASWRPQSVGRLVIFNAVPLTADFRWHWIARLWRRQMIGELLNATTNRWSTRQLLRQALVKRDSTGELAEQISRYFDAGTKRAILQLYRDADPPKLGEAGRHLGELRAPALVVWGDRDPYISPRFADFYADALGGEVEVEHIQAGHWPWLDKPEVVDQVAGFLSGERTSKPPPG